MGATTEGQRTGTAAASAIEIALAVFAGAAIYLAWRSPSLRVFGWAHAVGLHAPLTHLRLVAAPLRTRLPEFVLFCLPDGLFAYALVRALLRVWQSSSVAYRIVAGGLGATCAIAPEFLQAAHLLSGSFDVGDLVASVAGVAFAITMDQRESR